MTERATTEVVVRHGLDRRWAAALIGGLLAVLALSVLWDRGGDDGAEASRDDGSTSTTTEPAAATTTSAVVPETRPPVTPGWVAPAGFEGQYLVVVRESTGRHWQIDLDTGQIEHLPALGGTARTILEGGVEHGRIVSSYGVTDPSGSTWTIDDGWIIGTTSDGKVVSGHHDGTIVERTLDGEQLRVYPYPTGFRGRWTLRGGPAVTGRHVVEGTVHGVVGFDLDTGDASLLARGELLGVGGGIALVRRCDDTFACRDAIIDVVTGTERAVLDEMLELANPRDLRAVPPSRPVVVSPDGTRLAVVADDGVQLVDATTGARLGRVPLRGDVDRVTWVLWPPDSSGALVISARTSGPIPELGISLVARIDRGAVYVESLERLHDDLLDLIGRGRLVVKLSDTPLTPDDATAEAQR